MKSLVLILFLVLLGCGDQLSGVNLASQSTGSFLNRGNQVSVRQSSSCKEGNEIHRKVFSPAVVDCFVSKLRASPVPLCDERDTDPIGEYCRAKVGNSGLEDELRRRSGLRGECVVPLPGSDVVPDDCPQKPKNGFEFIFDNQLCKMDKQNIELLDKALSVRIEMGCRFR